MRGMIKAIQEWLKGPPRVREGYRPSAATAPKNPAPPPSGSQVKRSGLYLCEKTNAGPMNPVVRLHWEAR